MEFTSPWGQMRWKIREHANCKTPNIIVYILRCRHHLRLWSVRSTENLRIRWAGHKSDVKLKKTSKCSLAYHVHECAYPLDPTFACLCTVPTAGVKEKEHLLTREVFWQSHLGTLVTGSNLGKDVNALPN